MARESTQHKLDRVRPPAYTLRTMWKLAMQSR